jgi:hypothetical protein
MISGNPTSSLLVKSSQTPCRTAYTFAGPSIPLQDEAHFLQDNLKSCRTERKFVGIAESVAETIKIPVGQDQWSAGLLHHVDERRESL